MTKNEKNAALDALSALLGRKKPGQGPGPGGRTPQEFKDAWNKIMQKYDDDNIPDSELIKLSDQIFNGTITSLDW